MEEDNNISTFMKTFEFLRDIGEEHTDASELRIGLSLELENNICNIQDIIKYLKVSINKPYVVFTVIKPVISDDCTKLLINAYNPKIGLWSTITSFDLAKLDTTELYIDKYKKYFYTKNIDIINSIINLKLSDGNLITKVKGIVNKTITEINSYHTKKIIDIDMIMQDIIKMIDKHISDKYSFDLSYTIKYDTKEKFYTIDKEFNVSINKK